MIEGIEMATRENWWQGTANPFPQAAVAQSVPRPDAPTIPTPAVLEMRELIDEYVAGTTEVEQAEGPSPQVPDDGRVVVVEGDYGVGKTHLLSEALGRIEDARKAGLDPRPYYLVAPGGSFLLLYTEIMRYVGVSEMLARVAEFYADIVANDLRGRPYTDGLVARLERDEVDPQGIVADYGLREGALHDALHDRLRQRLSDVTADATFSRALMLLLQPEYRDIVWDWFTGGTPGQLLRELGLAEPIASDIRALEALGVVARIYHRNKRRFVLAVDEMEKLVLSWDRSDQARAQAFKKLLEVFRRTGALLIMAGLPEIFEILPRETRRVDAVIAPSGLERDNVRWYIVKRMQTVHDRRTVDPFTPDSIDNIVYLTGGLARDVVRLCYYAYDSAAATGKLITAEVVNKVALTRSRRGSRELVRNEIRRLLDEQARIVDVGWVFADIPGVTVDYWLPVDGQGAGCAVLFNDSILDAHQASLSTDRIAQVLSAEPRRAVIQVVSGYLPVELRQQIEGALHGQPLVVYSPSSFDLDFGKAVNTTLDAIVGVVAESSPGNSELRVIQEETSRLARQQAVMLRLIQESASREEQLLDAVHRTLAGGAGLASSPVGDEAADLPAELGRLFHAAEESLTAFGDVQVFIDDTLSRSADEPGVPFARVHRLRDPDAFTSVGALSFLKDLLLAFQRSVQVWLRSSGSASEPAGAPTQTERERLRGICQTYDALYGVAPLFKLERLPEIMSSSGGERPAASRAGRTKRTESLRGALDGLGDRVFEIAVRLPGASGR